MPCDCEEWSDTPRPVEGRLRFNAPDEPLVLWDGPVVGRTTDDSTVSVPARVTLAWRRRAKLDWSVDHEALPIEQQRIWRTAFRRSKSFGIEFGNQTVNVDASLGTEEGGSLNGGSVGDETARLDRVIVHWVGFPELMMGDELHTHTDDGWQTWRGRTQISMHGWDLTIDARRDLQDALATAKKIDACVLTHVMEVRRADSITFQPEEVKDLLWGLQCAVSFARGYWAYPAVPVGFDTSGTPVWSEWRPGFAEPGRPGLGWWDPHRPDDLWELVDKFLGRWFDVHRRRALQFAAVYAITAVETGFVEQRLLSAVTGLELLSWTIDVQERHQKEDRWKSKGAHARLSKLLTEAKIPVNIDPARTPALSAFADSNGYQDGPETIVEIRNSLTHPKDNESLYAAGHALLEAHHLSLRYLDLVLLHWIGYRGRTEDKTHRERWSGQSELVPWAKPRPSQARSGTPASS